MGDDKSLNVVNKAPEGYAGGFGAVCSILRSSSSGGGGSGGGGAGGSGGSGGGGAGGAGGSGGGGGGPKDKGKRKGKKKINSKDYDLFKGIFSVKETKKKKKTKMENHGYTGFGITEGESENAPVCPVVVKGAGGGCYVDQIPKEYVGDVAATNGDGSLVFQEMNDEKLRSCILRSLIPAKSKETYLQIYNRFISWINANKIKKIQEIIIIAYFNHLRDGLGRAPSSIIKEYSVIKKLFVVLQHTEIDYEKKKWNLAKDWITSNCNGYQQLKAPAFTQDQLQRLKDFPDPHNLYFMLKFGSFFGLNLRLRAGEYERLDFENCRPMIQGVFYIFIYFFLFLFGLLWSI